MGSLGGDFTRREAQLHRKVFRRSGFTLIELLLVIAMIAMFTSIFVLRIDTLLKQTEAELLEDAFWKAVEQAKQNSVFLQKPYILSYDDEALAFVITSGAERQVFSIDTNEMEGEPEIDVAFQEEMPQNGSYLVRGQLITSREIERVKFFPDGTCTPFMIDLTVSGYTNNLKIDPWTGAELVPMEEDETS